MLQALFLSPFLPVKCSCMSLGQVRLKAQTQNQWHSSSGRHLGIRQCKSLSFQTWELGSREVKWPSQGLPACLWQSAWRESLTRAFIFNNSQWPRCMLRFKERALTWNPDPGPPHQQLSAAPKVVLSASSCPTVGSTDWKPDRKLRVGDRKLVTSRFLCFVLTSGSRQFFSW